MKDNPLEISHVSKIYKMDNVEFNALTDISLTVKKGEFVAIMGPSGSGKSTLMHIIGCLDKPTSGKVLINGSDISSMNEKQLAKIRNVNIGFVFQQYNLLRRTPAIANVELPLVYARIPGGKRKELARAELEAVGLKDKLYNLPSQLSGGQQQRVAIARALVTNPSILLADEPTGNLDSKAGFEIMEIIKKLHQQGRTVIMVTHDLTVAKNAQRIIKIVDGRIVN
jgi:putative ABC transport system ATP-binding protein